MFPTIKRNALPLAVASSLSVAALVLMIGDAHAQQAQGQDKQLPTVDVTQPAPAKPATAKKKTAKKPSPPPAASEPAPAPVAAEPPSTSPATALGAYNPALELDGLQAPPGTTLTTAGPVYGYRALSAMSSTKTATPIEKIPQSIQVVPRSVIEDQTNISVSEAVQNVSNVQSINNLNIGNTDLAQSKVRGFKAEQWLDGLPVLYSTGDRDAFANVERIEVLKGPSAILYGGGSGAPIGGAINVISKLPTDQAHAEVGVTFGSDAYARPYFDINQPISPNVLVRVTGEYTGSNSFVDVLEQDRYSINPTITLTNRTDTTLTVQARASKFEQQAYPGLPAFGAVTGPFRIDRLQYIGDPDIDRSFTEVQGVTATFDHKFNSALAFNVKARWSQSEFDQNSQSPLSATPDVAPLLFPSTWSLINTEVAQEQEEFAINPNLIARFSAGPTENTFLIGADYTRATDQGHMFVDFGVAPVDLLNPVYPTPYTDPDPSSLFFFPFFDFENVYKTQGVYTQLQTSIFDRVHLMGGVRWAKIEVDYTEKALFDPLTFAFFEDTFRMEESKVLPRGGAVVDLFNGLSVYASYSEGLRWNGFNQAHDVKPELSEQVEGGFKFNLANQLSGTASVFEINRTNIPVTTGFAVASLTEQRSTGYELDLIWQPTANWQILANYGHVEAEILSGALAGMTLVEVPEDSGRVWINYAFDADVLKGWSAGAGIYVSSSQFVDANNVFKTEPYFTVDAKVGYDSEFLSASFNVKNLTDEEYFVPYPWFGGQVAPGADRQYFGTFAARY